jgi:hypothetical protein
MLKPLLWAVPTLRKSLQKLIMLTLIEVAQVLMRSAPRYSQSNPYAEEFEERRLRCLDAHKREETSRSMRRSSTGGLGVGATRALEVSSRDSASRQTPDPGSAPTSKTRNPQVFVVDHYA